MPFKPHFFVEGIRNVPFLEHLQNDMYRTEAQQRHKKYNTYGKELDISSCGHERHLNFFGFTNNTRVDVTRLSFTSKRAFFSASQCLKLSCPNITIFESHVNVELQFLHETGLNPTGWMRLETDTVDDNDSFVCQANELHNIEGETTACAPLVIASYDIEAYSSTGGFTKANNTDDVMFMIATTFQRLGEDRPYLNHVVTLDRADIEGAQVEHAADEGDLVQKWTDKVKQECTDILLAYNNWGFDDSYIQTRYEMSRPGSRTLLSRLPGTGSYIRTQRAEFAGYEDWRMLVTPGILNLDLHVILKLEHTLGSYTLDSVAEHFLAEHKIDLPAKTMFALYAKGRRGADSAAIGKIGRYCIKGTELPLKLIAKLALIPSMFEMAAATSVPNYLIFQRGASVRVMSMVVKKMHQFGMICPSHVGVRETYKGSTILEPRTGAFCGPVAVCDFASLYPSIMCRHQLCPSRLVQDGQYNELAGVQYFNVEADGVSYRFAQSPSTTITNPSDAITGSIPPAVLPSLLTEFAHLRKRAKDDLARAQDPWQRTLLDAKQKAFKVCMNAVYGVFGAHGPLMCKALAASVTAIGRRMIAETNDLIEKRFAGSEVVYGDTDSVFVHFPGGIDAAFKQGNEAAELMTVHFGAPIKLELEKVFYPLIISSKKRYAGLMYTSLDSDPVVTKTGLVRRDSCELVGDVCNAILDCLLHDRDIPGARSKAKAAARLLLWGDVDYRKLIMSRKLGDEYKSDNHAHVQVAKQMEELCAKGQSQAAPPQTGDRVKYLISNVQAKEAYKKAKDPQWLLNDSGLKIDYVYYFKHCFRDKVLGILLLVDPSCKNLFDDLLLEHKLRLEKQGPITKYFKKRMMQ